MAKSLDLGVIAEAIKTVDQHDVLRAKGCPVGQGFYFCVPMSAEDLTLLLTDHSIFDHLRVKATA